MLAEFDDTDENQVVALNSIIIIKKGGGGGKCIQQKNFLVGDMV